MPVEIPPDGWIAGGQWRMCSLSHDVQDAAGDFTFRELYSKWMDSNPHEVRARSKRIFGNRYMLEVCAALSEVSERTNLSSLIGDSGLSPSLYVGPLHRLEGVGLLVTDVRPDDARRERWYRPTPSGLWAAAQELAGP